MIVDSLKNAGLYDRLNDGFAAAFRFINAFLKSPLPEGRYDVDGERVYAMVQIYDTIDPAVAKLEAHKKYIDVQFVVSGDEALGWSEASGLTPSAPYDAEKDFTLFQERPSAYVTLTGGQFAVFLPHDAHLPKAMAGAPGRVVKIVVKVAA